jgi:ABC-type polysaccharide/polyol phosphate transport system ATPase subunit
LLRTLVPFGRSRHADLWALRDIDLTVATGETVGVVGRNGAGKSTLLRLLASVTRPTTGTVTIAGRVAPLLSVGVGFHQELTGRENVFVNGLLLGLTRDEIDDRLDSIVAFAELEEFIDTPVKFFSTGMFMRLGFSVAVHADPQILLVDEVLAVGDVAFQLKCLDRMRALRDGGTTIVIVSHSMHAIRLLCPRAILLHHGELVLDADADAVVARHHQLLSSTSSGGGDGGGGVTIVSGALHSDEGEVHTADQDSHLTARWRLRFTRDVDSPQLFFSVVGEDGQLAYSRHSAIGQRHRAYRAGEEADIAVAFRPAFGGGGTFRASILVTDCNGRDVLAADDGSLLLYVPPRLGVAGPADLEASIELDGTVLSKYESLLIGAPDDDPVPPRR